MFQVETDHQIVAHGNDLMHLYGGAGELIATATRTDEGWDVTTESTDVEGADNRIAAIGLLQDHAFAHLGPSNDEGHGYSTLISHGLTDLPE